MPSFNHEQPGGKPDGYPLRDEPVELADLAATDAPPAKTRRKSHSLDQSSPAARLKRLLLASTFSGLYLFLLAVFHIEGLVGRNTLGINALAVGAMLAGLYGIFAGRLNTKVSEQTLTAPIALAAIAIMLWTIYHAPACRIIFTPFVFILVAYGMYRLTPKAMLLLSAGAIVGYAAVIALQFIQRVNAADYKFALLHWLVLTLTLPGFAVLTGRVWHLHSALHRAGLKIRNIEEHARRDQLLGCYNRRYLLAALDEQKRMADRSGTPLCLAVIDLDHFKRINDEVGHLGGDDVLRAFARIAEQNVRQGDVFGRYGGEEFVLILPETPLVAALNTVERIREQVEQNCCHGKLQWPVTVSIGLTQSIPNESGLDLFSRADTAMYLAKRDGRNRVVVEESTPQT